MSKEMELILKILDALVPAVGDAAPTTWAHYEVVNSARPALKELHSLVAARKSNEAAVIETMEHALG